MPAAYTYPVWLLTPDDAHNHQVADMIEDDLTHFVEKKKQFYATLTGTQAYIQELHDMLEVFRVSQMMLVTLFRSNVNSVNANMPYIDIIRLKNRVKQTLHVWQNQCFELVHPFVSTSFVDTIHKNQKWDTHEKLTSVTGTPADWNGIILSRLSEIHHSITELFTHGESRLLIGRDIDADFRHSIAAKMLPAINKIMQNLILYKRLLDSF